VPDVVFYLLKTVLNRLLNTGSLQAVTAIMDQMPQVIERDYAGVIKRKLDEVYRNANSLPSGNRLEKTEKENRVTFIISLNDLDISCSHMERLVKDLLGSPSIPNQFLSSEVESVHSRISTLHLFMPKFRSTLKAGIDQLFNQLMRPRLRNLIPDVYKDVSYVLDEDTYNSAESQDLVRKRFVKAWEGLAEGYKDTFTENNFRTFFGLVLSVIIRPWEKFVTALKFNELGAIRFDQDIRSITSYMTSQTAFGDAREKFQRLQQISTILNLDREEDVDEFFSSSGINWKLNLAEARAVAALKI